MRWIYILFLSLSAVCCGGAPSGEGDKSTKKEYEQIVNKVDTMVLRRGVFRGEIISNGRLRAQKKSDLTFAGGGVVVRLDVANGQRVERGAIIAELDSDKVKLQLEQAHQSMNKAELELQDALLGFGYAIKNQDKVPDQVMSIARTRSGYDAAVLGLKSAELEVQGRIIRAPFAGRVANLKTKVYENPKGDFFCSVVDDSNFDVEFSVIENEVSGIFDGQDVKVSTFNDPSLRYSGKVRNINPTVDDKGLVLVSATIPNTGRVLMDGMNVKVFVEKKSTDKLVVPKSAVLIRDNRQVLFTYGADGKAHWVYVIVEQSNSTSHVVRANTDRGAELEQGEVVIISGNLNLADGSSVSVE